MTPRPSTAFEEWRSTQAQPGLFEKAPPVAPQADCDRDGHLYVETATTWPGETIERLTWTCTVCGDVRGRC